MKYRISPAKRKDLPALALIYQACFSGGKGGEKWPRRAALSRLGQIFSQPGAQGWTLSVYGQPVGFAFLQVRPGFDGPYGELLEAAVHPYFRRQGLGRALLSKVRQLAARRKLRVVYTLAYRGMFEGFYRKAGFKPSKRSMVYVWK